MPSEKNIKNYSQHLWIFISINFILFIAVILNKDFNFINEIYKNIFLGEGVLVALSTIATFILNGLLSSKFKTKLVFWRRNNIYPACRVFTDLIYEDDRIDNSILVNKHGELPNDPKYQNSLWYQIYKKHEFDPMIFNSHRNYLLSRDLTGLSFVFLLTYSIAASIAFFIINVSINYYILYLFYLIVQYLIISLVGRNLGKRFVCNVIAKECSMINN